MKTLALIFALLPALANAEIAQTIGDFTFFSGGGHAMSLGNGMTYYSFPDQQPPAVYVPPTRYVQPQQVEVKPIRLDFSDVLGQPKPVFPDFSDILGQKK